MSGSSSYAHRPMAGPSGPSQGAARLTDLLDFVKHEVDVLHSDSTALKAQNMEYETHTNAHSTEVSALRVTLSELEREHARMKQQYEEEVRRLRSELDAGRSGHSAPPAPATSGSAPPLPPPQVGHGPANLFGGIMHPGPAGSGTSHSSNPLPGPSIGSSQHQQQDGQPPFPGSTSNGWNRDRDSQQHEHPSKRMRIEDGSNGTAGQNGSKAGSPLHSHAPTTFDARPPPPPHLARSTGSTQSIHERRQSPPPPTPASAHPGDADPTRLPRELKVEGPDWTAVFNPKVRRELSVELVHNLTHDSVVCCVRFSPDGRMLATGCNRNVNIYDTTTGAKKHVLAEEATGKADNYIRSACFSPDGKHIATGAEDRLVRIWDIERKEILATFPGHRSEIYSLAYSPDGNYLVSGSGDRSAHIWDVRARSLLFTLPIDDQPGVDTANVDAGVTSVAISPNGKLVAAGSLDTIVRIWDMQTGLILDRLKAHKDSVYSVAFSPDGKWLVSGSLDKTLKLWDVVPLNNRPVKTEGAPADPTEGKVQCMSTLSGHKDYVLSVAVSPDAKWIVSGSKDRGVSFWDPRSTTAAVVLQGHKNSVISIAVSDKGNLLATGSGDWSCRIWRMSRYTNEGA